MLERGDATAEDIDTAMKLGAGYPMGPLELFDLTGIDTTHYLTLGWQEYAKRGLLPEELVAPTKLMAEMVEKGEIGRKSGKGFYDVSTLPQTFADISTLQARRRAGAPSCNYYTRTTNAFKRHPASCESSNLLNSLIQVWGYIACKGGRFLTGKQGGRGVGDSVTM